MSSDGVVHSGDGGLRRQIEKGGRGIVAVAHMKRKGELGACHKDARSTVVLGELLGDLQCPPTAGAAVEVEYGAADGGAEAEERREPEVGARGSAAGVGAEDKVGDVRGRAVD